MPPTRVYNAKSVDRLSNLVVIQDKLFTLDSHVLYLIYDLCVELKQTFASLLVLSVTDMQRLLVSMC